MTQTQRLTQDIYPHYYHIHLTASLNQDTFSSEVIIHLEILKAVKKITLHAKSLTVHKAYIASLLSCQDVTHVDFDKTQETVTLTFKNKIHPGAYTLSIESEGALKPGFCGLYLAEEGHLKAMVTQCEATSARMIIPCFDEPCFKSSFEWVVSTDPDLSVITNGVFERIEKNQKTWTHFFKPTALLSSYLLAVTIGEYQSSPVFVVGKTPCTVVTSPGKQKMTTFAQDITSFALPYFERYFGLPYHYQKLDQVAAYSFDAGAMENAGAIFYRQNLLLCNEKKTSFSAKKRIAEVIAHEIAHQWFGNRVTMAWWDDLWLNEAFATWIAYKAIDAYAPDWCMWDDFNHGKEDALIADALNATHPVFCEVKNPAQVTELFDVITYEKGGAILRMFEQYLGESKFRAGIRHYMKQFKDANATRQDLWQSLSLQVKKNVSGNQSESPAITDMMEQWVTQEGFPLLSLGLSKDKQTLVVAQKRFISQERKTHKKQNPWPVPLKWRIYDGKKSTTHLSVFKETHASMSIKASDNQFSKNIDCVFLNYQGTGFYRTHYDDVLLTRLLSVLNSLHPSEKACLLSDEWALCLSQYTSLERYIKVLLALKQETSHAVIETYMPHMYLLDHVFGDCDFIKNFAVALMPVWTQLKSQIKKNTQETNKQAFACLFKLLGGLGQIKTVQEMAAQIVAQEQQSKERVDANLAAAALAVHASCSSHTVCVDYVKVLCARIEQKTAPDLQMRYINALCYFKSPQSHQYVFKMIQQQKIPAQHNRTLLVLLLQQRTSCEATWQFLKSEWTFLRPYLGEMGVGRVVESLAFLPDSYASDIRTFFEQTPVPEASRALLKAFEKMQLLSNLKKCHPTFS